MTYLLLAIILGLFIMYMKADFRKAAAEIELKDADQINKDLGIVYREKREELDDLKELNRREEAANNTLKDRPTKIFFNGQEISREKLHEILNDFSDVTQDLKTVDSTESHEEYMSNLPQYKEIIDRTPNHFLDQHLETELEKEHYLLAAYIKQAAKERGFKLKQ